MYWTALPRNKAAARERSRDYVRDRRRRVDAIPGDVCWLDNQKPDGRCGPSILLDGKVWHFVYGWGLHR